MSSKPVVVYLDSSDISVLSNPLMRTDELIQMETTLLDMREKGLIEFRFSMIHVIEAAPKDQDSIEWAKQRFNYLSMLCNNKCIASYVDILEQEVTKLSEEGSSHDLSIYNDESRWFPKLEISGTDDLLSMIEEQILSFSDRKQRRIARRKLLTDSGEIRQRVLLNINAEHPAFVQAVMDKYPLTHNEASSYFRALAEGRSASSAETVINAFSKLDRLGAWYEKQWDRIIPTSSYLRNIGQRLKDAIQIFTEQSKKIYEARLALGYEEQQIKQEQQELLLDSFNSISKGLAERISNQLNIPIDPNKLSWDITPSLLTATTLSSYLAKQSLYTGGSVRSARVSDFGDISHTFYLPHVDIFRVDGYISSVISEAKLPFKTVVVGNLSQLLEAIDKKLQSS